MRRLAYFLRETLGNIRANRTTTFVAIGTTGVTLACFGVFLLLYLNLRSAVGSLQDEIQVILYLDDGQTKTETASLRERLTKEPEVETITFISKSRALDEFRRQFPADQHLLDGLGINPLPASLVITVAPAFRSPESIRRWVARLDRLPGVTQVQYSREWIENLETIVGYLELAAVGIGALLAVASVTIIASTIRLTVYARRDEIEIMRLIGATNSFIKIPYLLEGAILGAVGGVLAILLLRASFEVFASNLGQSGRFLGIDASLAFLPLRVSAQLVVAGLALGSAGSYVSLLNLGGAK